MIKKWQVLLATAVLFCFLYPAAVSATGSSPPAFTAFTPSATTVSNGDTITVNIKTTSNVTHVFAEYGNPTVRTAATQKLPDANGQRNWTLSVKPAASVSLLKIYANTANSTVSAAVVNLPITVSGGSASNTGNDTTSNTVGTSAITSVTRDKTEYFAGDTVNFTIKTSSAVEHVFTQCDGAWYKAVRQSTDTTGKTWKLSVRPKASQALTIYANSVYMTGNAARVKQTLDMKPTTSKPQSAQIISMKLDARYIDYGERVRVTITTNPDAEYVWVNCDGKDFYALSPSTSGGNKVWTVNVNPKKSQTLTGYANSVDSKSGADFLTERINVEGDEIKIKSATAAYISSSSDDVQVLVTTNAATGNVYAETSDTDPIRLTLIGTDRTKDEKTWRGTLRNIRSSSTRIFVTACYDAYEDEDAFYTINRIDVTSGVSVDMSVTSTSSSGANTVKEGGQLTLTVTTTDSSIDYLLITNPFTNSTHKISKADYGSGKYTYSQVFTASDSGLVTGFINLRFEVKAFDNRDMLLQTKTLDIKVTPK